MRKRPSPATIIAFVALLVALGGTSYAALKIPPNSVGTKQLKKKAVGKKQLKNKAVSKKQLKNNSVGTKAIQDAAVTGEKLDPDALTHSTRVRTFLANTAGNTALGEAEATCEPGELLIGGGGGWVNNVNPATSYQLSGTISDSGPSKGSDLPADDGTAPAAWHVSGRNTTGGNARMLAYAICLS